MDGERRGRIDPARLHERAHREDEAGRITTRIRDAVGRSDARTLECVELGQAVGPVRVDAMGRACVEHAHAGPLDQGDGLAGRGIGQAEDDGVGFVQ